MKRRIIFLLLSAIFAFSYAKPRTIHVMVALCDNETQGIVPVPAAIGKGDDPAHNLYWGAAYGIKNFFDKKTSDWKLIKTLSSEYSHVLSRVLFKHRSEDVYLLAEAYHGAQMKICLEDYILATNAQHDVQVCDEKGRNLDFGGKAEVVAFIGHNGLMDVRPQVKLKMNENPKPEAVSLCCYSRDYFSPYLKKTGAQPLLFTTHLMAPEAYTLKAALDGWIRSENKAQIHERAAQAYHQYQKCGIRGARNLFTTRLD